MAPTENELQEIFVPKVYVSRIIWPPKGNDDNGYDYDDDEIKDKDEHDDEKEEDKDKDEHYDDDKDKDEDSHHSKKPITPIQSQPELVEPSILQHPPAETHPKMEPQLQSPPDLSSLIQPSIAQPPQPASAISPNSSAASTIPFRLPSANFTNEPEPVPNGVPKAQAAPESKLEGDHIENSAPTMIQPPLDTLPKPSTFGKGSSDSSSTILSPAPGEPRKEINPSGSNSSSIISTKPLINQTTSNTVPGLASVDRSSPLSSTNHVHNDAGVLSPTAEHILIAVGSIGAFIIFLALFFFIYGMRGKKGFFNLYGHFEFPRDRQGDFYEIDQRRSMKTSEQPPHYSYQKGPFTQFPYDEKSDVALNTSQISRATDVIGGAPRYPIQGIERVGSFKNSNNFDPTRQVETYANPPYYSNFPHLSEYESSGTLNTVNSSNYNNPGTLASYVTQTSSIYDPNQIRDPRLSYVSSISSGFGDGLGILAPSVVTAKDSRPAQRDFVGPPSVSKTRMSWFKASNRESFYSSSSIDTAPRFRTVKSWVKLQSDRLELKSQSNSDKAVHGIPNTFSSFAPSANSDVNMQNEDSSKTYQQDPVTAKNLPRTLQ
ncbi:hypothetical protein Golomagni_05197 [Golovinomyces magnicellulatus]|nr:hypothetical protein Golomagni_05197 [Golovinomyces magnicellulatus]